MREVHFQINFFQICFFFLPSTVDRNEKINKYLNSVNLRPFSLSVSKFGENFDSADINFNREAVVNLTKKVALQSSQNLKRNADAFLSTTPHDNDKLLWPDGKRTQSEKFTLTY